MTDTLTRALQALPELPEPAVEDHDMELWGQNIRVDLYTGAQLLTYARAALAAASAPGVPAGSVLAAETAWLVEWKANGYGPQWWGFNYEPGKRGMWCSDDKNAVRFARKEDAERMRLHIIAIAGLIGHHDYERSISATEHEWCDGRLGATATSPPPPTEQPEQARQPLTDEQIARITTESTGWQNPTPPFFALARAIESAHGILPATEQKQPLTDGWRLIESAPRDGTEILLSNGRVVAEGHWLHAEPYIRENRDLEGRYIGQDESDGHDGWVDWSGGMLPAPTHWMPLPAPPIEPAKDAQEKA